MGHITLRTNDAEDAVIAAVLTLTGERTASSAIKKVISEYEQQQQELKRLKKELDQATFKNRNFRQAIKAFQTAQYRTVQPCRLVVIY